MPAARAVAPFVVTQATLRLNPVLAAAADATVERLLKVAYVRQFGAGELVQGHGDSDPDLVMVLSGCLRVGLHGLDGQRHIRWYLEPGQLFSVIPIVDGGPVVHDAVAHEAAQVLFIPGKVFRAALQLDIGLSNAVLRMVCERSRLLYEMAAADSLRDLDARAAHMILLLAKTYGQSEGESTRIGLRLSQDDLADLLGVTRQSVSRVLKAFVASGAIALKYSQIWILDGDWLRRRSEEPSRTANIAAR